MFLKCLKKKKKKSQNIFELSRALIPLKSISEHEISPLRTKTYFL